LRTEITQLEEAVAELPPVSTDLAQNLTQSGDAQCPPESLVVATAVADDRETQTPNPLPLLEFGVDWPGVAPVVVNSGGGTRTPDTRIMIPLL
jgi:hypothetical protein